MALDVGTAQAVERQPRDVRMRAQRGLVVRSARDHDQHARTVDPLEAALDQLQRGRVDPVCVFDDHQHGSLLGHLEQLLDHHLQRALAQHLRCHFQRAVAPRAVEPQQRGVQGRRFLVVAHQRFEFVERRFGRIVHLEACRAAQALHHRPQRAARVIGRALPSDRPMGLARTRVGYRTCQARLADARLAHQQHHLPFAALRQRPALEQQCQLLVRARSSAPDQALCVHRSGCRPRARH